MGIGAILIIIGASKQRCCCWRNERKIRRCGNYKREILGYYILIHLTHNGLGVIV